MSTSSAPPAVERCRAEDATPVTIAAEDLESTAPEYLRDLKYDLSQEDHVVAHLTVEACFEEDCSIETNREVERLRKYVRAAAFLGASRITVDVQEVSDHDKVDPALEACEERARREGVTFDVRT